MTSPTPWPGSRPGPGSPSKGRTALFTDHARRRGRVLLVGAGVGITPIRALLEDLPDGVDVAVILRGSRPDELVLRDEVAAMVRGRPGRRLARGGRPPLPGAAGSGHPAPPGP